MNSKDSKPASLPRYLMSGALSRPAALPSQAAGDEPVTAPKAVTVTATRREESLQKVPVAVSVIDGEQLERERDNRNNASCIVQQVPSLNFRAAASNKDTSLFSDSYEIVLKFQGLGNRLTANLAVFRIDYDNYPANFYDRVGTSAVPRLIDAGEVISEGVELDAAFQATRSLKLSGALAYSEARVDSFQCPSGSVASCNADGQPLPFSPDWKIYLRADYSISLNNGWDLELATDYNWRNEVQYSLDQNPDTEQGAYGLWNATLALAGCNAGWRIAVIGKNLTDKSHSPLISSSANGTTRIVPRDDVFRHSGAQGFLNHPIRRPR